MKKTRMILTMALSLILVLAMGMPAFAGSSLTAKEAASKAIKDSGVARSNVSRLETEREKGRFEVEFKNKQTRDWYEYEVGASSGRILEKSVDYAYKHNSSKDKVGKTRARKAAAKIAGVRYTDIKDCKCTYEYDTKDKEGTYEVKFRKGSYRYEIEVLAPTGKVIEFEKEYVKK